MEAQQDIQNSSSGQSEQELNEIGIDFNQVINLEKRKHRPINDIENEHELKNLVSM